MRNNKLTKNVGTPLHFKRKKGRKTHRLNRPDCSTFYPDRVKLKDDEQNTSKEL
jgi:hypothetical protein